MTFSELQVLVTAGVEGRDGLWFEMTFADAHKGSADCRETCNSSDQSQNAGACSTISTVILFLLHLHLYFKRIL